MADANSTASPLEAAAGAASPNATDAFKLLSDETRLAILVALWEAYDPRGTDEAVAFSELYDRVTLPADDETLRLTLDGGLDVVDVTRSDG